VIKVRCYTKIQGRGAGHVTELGVQFARQGIRVNALCPGPVNTPPLQELFAKDPHRAARRLVHVPLGRFAEPDKIAAAIAFLVSQRRRLVHHRLDVLVDGGIRDVIAAAQDAADVVTKSAPPQSTTR
jgi:NAD(P)-dependent dehydrogenase (short-subunit alcohol dehydrogenase family)